MEQLGFLSSLHELKAGFEQADTIEDIRYAMRGVADMFELDWFVFGYLDTGRPDNVDYFLINGYPDAWRDRYDEKGYMIHDPIVRDAFRTQEPILWEDVGLRRDIERGIMAEAASFGVCSGISCTYRGMYAISLTSFASRRPAGEMREFLTAFAPVLALVTQYAHNAADRMADCKASGIRTIDLTNQQQQTLAWLAAGKTNEEIATILGISVNTVKTYRRQLAEKLNATNAASMAYKAERMGLLSPFALIAAGKG